MHLCALLDLINGLDEYAAHLRRRKDPIAANMAESLWRLATMEAKQLEHAAMEAQEAENL